MTAKRALVVDDSKSARISLQKMLEKYHIAVDFAESGEDALDYLKHHLVDAIFMDHSMPGMDGLETVVAIKSNPRTATIPVMMYTAKEGEVYVSQARALGAIGVLPKQVQPGVLFEMLNKLGLVREDGGDHALATVTGEPPAAVVSAPATTPPSPVSVPAAERPQDRAPERAHERFVDAAADLDYDRQALGASVQALITKVLNEQHVKLRSDILTAHRDFARQVAAEILAKERPSSPVDEAPPPAEPAGARGGWLVLLIPLLLVAGLYWQSRVERSSLAGEVDRLAAVVEERDATIESMSEARLSDLDTQRDRADDRYLKLVGAVEWALNQGGLVGYDEPAFDDRRAVELETLLGELVATGFQGTVRLESHLGEFCLAPAPEGGYRLAAPGAALDDCSPLGHPLDDSAIAEERQSASFASFVVSSPLVNASGIEVQIVAHDRESSVPAEPIPVSISTAGEWNEAARRNHRVQYSIIPADS